MWRAKHSRLLSKPVHVQPAGRSGGLSMQCRTVLPCIKAMPPFNGCPLSMVVKVRGTLRMFASQLQSTTVSACKVSGRTQQGSAPFILARVVQLNIRHLTRASTL